MTTTRKNSLIGLAKGEDKKAKTPANKKEVVLTPAEERDLKAKAKVDKLLEGVDLTLKKGDDLLEIDTPPKDSGDILWLQDEVSKLTEENERLKSEVALAKGDYGKLFDDYQKVRSGVLSSDPNNDGALRLKVVQLFNEIQAQQISLGANFFIHPPSFLLRLIMFFPFLESEKRF